MHLIAVYCMKFQDMEQSSKFNSSLHMDTIVSSISNLYLLAVLFKMGPMYHLASSAAILHCHAFGTLKYLFEALELVAMPAASKSCILHFCVQVAETVTAVAFVEKHTLSCGDSTNLPQVWSALRSP